MSTQYFSDNGVNHFEEIKTWFTDNASEYFDSFVLSDDKLSLSCIKDGIAAITFSRTETGSGLTAVFTSKHGASKSETIPISSKVAYIYKLIKTTCGIAVGIHYDSDQPCGIFITKTDKDGLGVVWHTGLYNTGNLYAMSFENSRALSSSIASTANVNSSAVMSLAPMALGTSGDFCPHLFISFFSNFKGKECYVLLNGVKYYSDGYLDLKV